MIAALGYEFFRNALLAGILASVACGIIGSFVVVKRMVSLSGGISHASFGGIGLGYYLGFDPIAGAMVFCIAVAAFIARLRSVAHQHLDTLVGAVWAGGMAFGIMLIYLTPGFAPDLFGYLFGNILLVPSSDLFLMFAIVIGIILIIGLFYNHFLAVTFDEEYASVMNIPSGFVMTVLLILTAVTIVMLIQVVGIILVIALLTLPAAIAREFTGNLKMMIYLSVLTGIFFTTTGIFLSYELNVPSGATIILFSVIVYLIVIGFKKNLRKKEKLSE
ncbi:metal ABC transporter permease [Methanomicrobium antiquum]|uniref:Metal ABC transporter permease n=2 Tax=Methanomicrobium antiquum TaxID=487686 RepID=A0AAF0JP28_9EURY|nr:metal ABC transporter permease [Methanomicrobium antiquum]MDD3977540.1 metal ABC transporter permease [Methanomicrobium sp.]WFN37991.1 metal ABC transporter permease [Methanomicrobium antiquum]